MGRHHLFDGVGETIDTSPPHNKNPKKTDDYAGNPPNADDRDEPLAGPRRGAEPRMHCFSPAYIGRNLQLRHIH